MYSAKDQGRVTAELRELLAAGWALGDALRELHGVRGLGLLWLVSAVESACGLPKAEARRVVVRETFPLRRW